jgi:hypothetical protein
MAVAGPRGPGDEHAEQRDPGQQRDEHAGVADTAVALMISTAGLIGLRHRDLGDLSPPARSPRSATGSSSTRALSHPGKPRGHEQGVAGRSYLLGNARAWGRKPGGGR